MKIVTKLALLASLSALLISACGSDSPTPSTSSTAQAAFSALAERGASGEAIANGWFALLAATSSPTATLAESPEQARAHIASVKPYLDPAFQIQRASGQRYLAADYVPSNIHKFTISDVVSTEPNDSMKVVRYGISTPGATTSESSAVLSSKVEPRISVFRWDQDRGHWVIVSHANFNTSVVAACDKTPVQESKEQPTTSAEDVATGEALVHQWRAITVGESKADVLDPQNQIQLADGEGWPNPDGSQIKWSPAKSYEPHDIVVTRHGELLVASYSAVETDLSVEGKAYAAASAPRLLTYRLADKDQWKLIALANFNSPKKASNDADCATKAP
ncbi:MAG: hypothetical protein WCK06_10045 [Actinomycetota bacterium]